MNKAINKTINQGQKLLFSAKHVLKYIFKYSLTGILIFQLICYSCISQANTKPTQSVQTNSISTLSPQDRLQRADNFLKENVESLRAFFYTDKENESLPYSRHPLDTFGLIKQQPLYKSENIEKIEKAIENRTVHLNGHLKEQSLALEKTEQQEILETLKNTNKAVPENIKKRAVELITPFAENLGSVDKLADSLADLLPEEKKRWEQWISFYNIDITIDKNLKKETLNSISNSIQSPKELRDYLRSKPLLSLSDRDWLITFFERQNPISEKEQKNRIAKYEKAQKEIQSLQSKLEGNPQLGIAGERVKHKRNNKIPWTDILVEVVEDSDQIDKSSEKVVAVLSHPEKLALNNKILSIENSPTTVVRSWTNSGEGKLSFRLSYRGKTVHTFPQNIEWIAFFENYLIFLESPKVQETKALLSFIDLQFFEPAIGHTTLAIFDIPVHFPTSGISAKELLAPKIVIEDLPETILHLDKIAISKSQIDYLSQNQQLTFNTMVALLDPASAEISQEYLKQWVTELRAEIPLPTQDPTGQQLSIETQQQILEVQTQQILENQRQIGTSQQPSGEPFLSGNYGILNNLVAKLSEIDPTNLSQTDKKTIQDFKEALQKNKAFIASINQTQQAITAEQKFWSRFFLFISSLTQPQPLGAPKIKTALALVANSVSLKGDSIQNRVQAFAEAFKQMAYPVSHRSIGMASLVGLSAVASPEIASFYFAILNSMLGLTKQMFELISVTGKTSFQWVSLDNGIYQSYFEGDKKIHFTKGLTALTVAFIGSLGILHLVVNSVDYVKFLGSKKEQKHRKQVSRFFAQFKEGIRNLTQSTRSDFINYVNQGQKEFLQGLSQGQMRRLGIPAQLSFGFNNIQSDQTIKTDSTYADLLSAWKKQELSGQLNFKDFIIELKKVPTTTSLAKNQVAISIEGTKSVFEGKPADLKLLLAEDRIKKELSPIKFEIYGERLHIKAVLLNADFTPEDNIRLNEKFAQIEKERGKDILTQENSNWTKQEIKTLKQALAYFSFREFNWSRTVQALGKIWNWFFLNRYMITAPVTFIKKTWYQNYFDIIYTKQEIPTIFNGGKESRITRAFNKANNSKDSQQIKEFEEKILELQKQVLTQVRATALLETALLAISNPRVSQKQQTQILSQSYQNLDPTAIKNTKLKIFLHQYERQLMNEVMRHILAQGQPLNLSDSRIKWESFKTFVEQNTLPKADPELIKSIIESRFETIKKEVLKSTNNLVYGFLNRWAVLLEQATEKSLNPKKSGTINRYAVAEEGLNNPEALTRATRSFLADLVVDKPLQLLFLFVILAGAEQGILQVLHDKAFSESAWAHFGRHVIWNLFFAQSMLGILAGTWWKLQQDARLDATGGFDNIPNKQEAEAGYLRWLFKQLTAPNNSLGANYSYALKLAWFNLIPGTILFGLVSWATLGRFDLELWLAGLLIYVVTPMMALQLKIENGIEKSMFFSLTQLIKDSDSKDKEQRVPGFDLQGEERRFLGAPSVQSFHLKESSKRRRLANFWFALLYHNPMANILTVFENIDTSSGSRGFLRLFAGGQLPTEYFVNFMDFLENKNIVSPNFSESCKSIFTNNRTDL